MRGENIRRRNISSFPSRSEIDTPKYHAPIQSHVVAVSGIPIHNVFSYDPSQPSIPTLSIQTLAYIPSYPTNSTTGGKPPKQVF